MNFDGVEGELTFYNVAEEDELLRLHSSRPAAKIPSLATGSSPNLSRPSTINNKAPVTIQSLPPETLCKIMEHAVAERRYERTPMGYKRRCEVLRACSLVCSTWSQQARARLWYYVYVPKETTARLVAESPGFLDCIGFEKEEEMRLGLFCDQRLSSSSISYCPPSTKTRILTGCLQLSQG